MGCAARGFHDLQRDDTVRAVILTGAGGNFCTGADMDRRGGMHPPLDRMREINTAALAVAEFSKPVVASVEGYAVGAGWNLALLCDVVVASRTAKFSQIFARRGLSVDFGGSWILPPPRRPAPGQTTGHARRHRRRPGGVRAGLVTELADPADLGDRTAALAARLAEAPPSR